MTTTPAYRVDIVHPVTGTPKTWDTYSDRDSAESIAGTLRDHGIAAQVVCIALAPGETP